MIVAASARIGSQSRSRSADSTFRDERTRPGQCWMRFTAPGYGTSGPLSTGGYQERDLLREQRFEQRESSRRAARFEEALRVEGTERAERARLERSAHRVVGHR